MSRSNPSNEWRIIGGVEIWFNADGKAVRADVKGTTKYPYIFDKKTGTYVLAIGELSYQAVKSRTPRGTIRWG